MADLEPAAAPWIAGVDLLAWRRARLSEGGRAVDLDWLLDLEGGLRWPDLQRLRLDPDRPVRLHTSLGHLEELWRRHRCHAVPLQYLVGRCPWRDLELQVAPGVLIPRQETEALVELALAATSHPGGHRFFASVAPPRIAAPALWADLGTGSACLAVALALAYPEARGFAVDLSADALEQARRNLAAAQVLDRVSLLCGSWWEPLQAHWGQLDLVLANPPYIPSFCLAGLDPVVRDHEPSLALDGGPDGLTCLRSVIAGAAEALRPGGLLLLEHHHDQSPAVLALMAEAGLVQPTAHQDLEGVWRFACARRAGASGPELVPGRRVSPPASAAGHRPDVLHIP
ncbi:MAG: HemK/PrmC family methyltransferase [Synechococcaceae cyanobacterium]|nr:HemK/PrmC family methyltransferase [Synechococcaceae cyanobacterium]